MSTLGFRPIDYQGQEVGVKDTDRYIDVFRVDEAWTTKYHEMNAVLKMLTIYSERDIGNVHARTFPSFVRLPFSQTWTFVLQFLLLFLLFSFL